MNKVMLVYDENLIIKDLIEILNWNELGLKITKISNNRNDAIKKFIEDPVDIIISDINIPYLNGLELLKHIKSINNKTRFVIISGYDKFSYVKEALKYGADNYILKPIDKTELKLTLEKIIIDINNDRDIENKILTKNRILFQYINGNIYKKELVKIKNYLGFPLENRNYTVAIITFINKNKNDLTIFIEAIFKEIFIEGYEILHRYDGQIILINSWEKDIKYSKVKNFYEKLKNKIIGTLKQDIFISIGDLTDSIDEIEFTYNIAMALNKYMLTEGKNICLDRHSLKYVNNTITFTKELETINKLIIKRNFYELKNYIEDIFDNNELTPKNIYDFCIKIIFLIHNILEEFKLEKINDKYEDDSLSNIILELCNENNKENIKKFVIYELRELINLMVNADICYSPIIRQVINVINKNYNEELSLKTLAQKYNINSSYLGQIFTKEVGVSFSEYLNKIKNNKAKDLILNTNMKINDIAKSVGYIDTSYFYRKFKKYFGVCPSTLRNMKKY
ncbi:response regulator transcription factor [Candidatus Arthromitus sp. SFB-rat-Yit]|uniref:response regulator transcription factor n=1 Tax=Candidatus Arthromitus sp. SFB-rat-Yit TaxID=1041504 RepID=UPI000227A07B|nr:helix-turn-helix domain-containing protein [Candidatus Arthromitus sp. SFB-rat-Yit]BAK81222.1 DNA-binding response regulator, AraC family [Candidatus Arthromitus sp. SFB-rat-Yit]